jgi:ABC-type antimicrobial peptide transport system permease subunit
LIVEQVESSKEDLSIDEIKLQDELMENYSFEMSIGYISAVLIVGSLVLGISVILPIGYISKLNVRKILL